MRKLLLPACVACLVAPVIAQTGASAPAGAVNSSWHCKAPSPAYIVPVPDQANHAYGIDQIACAATKGEIAGVKEQDGIATEFAEVTGNTAKGHGVFVETLASGDKITIAYQSTGTMNNNQMQSGSNTWTVTSGTGKVKGITGKGTCKAKGNPDGTADFDCTGTYTIPK
jgi:hypothetical protein